MSQQQFWVNLPVKNAKVSQSFYENIGFELNDQYANNDQSVSFYIGEHNVVLMLFANDIFKGFINSGISNPKKGNEVLFSISASSKEEVDVFAVKVILAGGKLYAEPKDVNGYMYGLGFEDPDGHKWNLLYMKTETE